MNSRFLWILLVIMVVLIGAWFVYGRSNGTSETATTTSVGSVTPHTPATTTPETLTITYTDEGFSPTSVTINVGDTVRFVNRSSGDFWVASDEHPTHTNYDGTATRDHCADGVKTNDSFDQCVRSAPSTSWSYTFEKAGSFDYHNHARAAHGGTIIVR